MDISYRKVYQIWEETYVLIYDRGVMKRESSVKTGKDKLALRINDADGA